jgi:hypothetical protein
MISQHKINLKNYFLDRSKKILNLRMESFLMEHLKIMVIKDLMIKYLYMRKK